MVWAQFFLTSLIVVLAAVKLTEYGNAIALRTRLGGMFIGTLLVAGATSLPELLTTINSLDQGVPNLAAGNIFGSSMFNMFLLALLDTIYWRARILRRVAMRHALTASLATLLTGMAVFFLLANIDVQVGWVGMDSLLIMGGYIFGVWLIRSNTLGGSQPVESPTEEELQGVPSLLHASIGFAAASGLLIVVMPTLVSASVGIAEITGLGTSFVGAAMLAVVTSLPEMVAMLAAARFGAYDLAVGNLFGSNVFNMFALGMTDFFWLPGRFLGDINPAFALAGLLGLLLTTIGLISNLARVERRLLVVEVDALFLMAGYGAGLWFLYARGAV